MVIGLVTEEPQSRLRAETTRSFGVAAFPFKQWNEWDESCKEEFGDCRWIKMWHDHSVAKHYQNFERLEKKLLELEEKIDGFISRPKEEPKKNAVKTFGGEIEEVD